MDSVQSPDEIRHVAKILDDAVEARDTETALSCFADECEIEFPGIVLQGKEGLQQSLAWLYRELGEIRFEPIVILVVGNVFFKEFVLEARHGDRPPVRIKATEVLVYRDFAVTNMRLCFESLILARTLARGFLERWLVGRMERASLRGLVG